MNKPLSLTVLKDSYLDLSTAVGPQRTPLIDVESLLAGAQFGVEATTPISGYFYVVQIGADHHVHVVYPSAAVRHVSAGDALVVPGQGQWLLAVIDGPVRLVVANQPVADADWPTLDPGRDGPAHTPTGDEGRMIQKPGEIGQTTTPPPQPTSNQGKPPQPKHPSTHK